MKNRKPIIVKFRYIDFDFLSEEEAPTKIILGLKRTSRNIAIAKKIFGVPVEIRPIKGKRNEPK